MRLQTFRKFQQGNFNRTVLNIPSHQQTYHKPSRNKFTELWKNKFIRSSCGPLCDISRLCTDGPYFNQIKAPMNCRLIVEIHILMKVIPSKYLKNTSRALKRLYDGKQINSSCQLFQLVEFRIQSLNPCLINWRIDLSVRLAAKGVLGKYVSSETNGTIVFISGCFSFYSAVF